MIPAFLLLSPLYFLACFLLPELNILALLFIGRITYESRLALVGPFSLNHINCLIFCIHLIMTVQKNPKGFLQAVRGQHILFILMIWLTLNGLMFSQVIDYSWEKLTGSLIGLGCGVLIISGIREELADRVKLLLIFLAATTGFFILAGLYQWFVSVSEFRLAVFSGGPLTLARYAAVGVLLAGAAVVKDSIQRRQRIFYAVWLFLGLLTVILTESKGPLLFLVGLLVILFLFSKSQFRMISRIGVVVLILCFVTGMIFLFGLESRFFLNPLTETDPNGSYTSRLIFFQRSLELFFQNPLLGSGLGNFALHGTIAGQIHEYPHNIFLEIGSETGCIGLGLFLIWIIRRIQLWAKARCSTKKEEKARELRYSHFVFLMGIFFLLNQMVSGDLGSDRFIWFFFILQQQLINPKTNFA